MASPLADVRLGLVETLDDALALREWLGERRDGPLAIDTESGGLDPFRHKLRTIQIGDTRQGWVIPWERWGGFALEIMESWEGDWVAHHGCFDWRFIKKHTGFEIPWHKLGDTMTMAGLDHPLRAKGLKPLSGALIDRRALAGERALKDGMHANKWDWATVPVDFPPYWNYGALDPVLTAHLDQILRPRVEADCPEAYALERSANRNCALMMMHGFSLDVPYVEKAIKDFRESSEKVRAWLKSAHSITSPMSGGQLKRAFEALGEEVISFTPQGAPRYDKETLGFYRKNGKNGASRQLAEYILAVRHMEKMIGSYLENFLTLRDENDVIHPSINVMAARTGRMSVTDPALQTLPRDDKVIRGAFIPRPGHVFISCDLDQVEARLAAHFSGDEGLIQAFYDADHGGGDFFCGIASDIFGEPIQKSDNRRTLTKNVVYGSLFSAGVETMARTAGVSMEQMEPVKREFDRRFPGLKQLSDRVVRESRENSPASIRSPLGRMLMFDPGREGTQALNALIQGHAAEYAKQCLVKIDNTGLGDAMRLVVHDEVILEVPTEDAQDALKEVEEAMSDRVSYRVPLTAGGSILPERWVKL